MTSYAALASRFAMPMMLLWYMHGENIKRPQAGLKARWARRSNKRRLESALAGFTSTKFIVIPGPLVGFADRRRIYDAQLRIGE
jgi:hypothetical protein